MFNFLSDLIIVRYLRDKDRNTVLLLEPYYFEYNGKKYYVPAGFRTDFASFATIPYYDITLGNKLGKTLEPSVIHDWLYSEKILSRKEADYVFLLAMEKNKIGKIKRSVYYFFVRMFGWLRY